MYHAIRSAPGVLGTRAAAVFVATIFLSTTGDVRAQCQTSSGVQHRASDGGSQDQLGTSVAVGNGVAMLGAAGHPEFTETGAVYVVDSSSGSWTVTGKLMASDGVAGAKFGSAVATDGQWALIGAAGASVAYIFRNDGGTWVEHQKLSAPESAPSFGFAVGLSGNTAVVGAFGALSYSGKAYVYTLGGSTWTHAQTLAAPDAAAYDFFGAAVGVSGDVIAVGAYGEDTGGTNAGSVYMYRNVGGGWSHEQTLKPDDVGLSDSFGRTVAISGDIVVGGSPKNDSTGSDSGAAYAYWYDGNSWQFDAKLVGTDTVAGDKLGSSVAIDGSIIVIGSPFWDDDTGITNRGAAYPFVYDGTTWQEMPKLIAYSPYGWFDDAFGSAVGVADGVAISAAQLADGPGRDAGHVYTFEMTCSETEPNCVNNVDCNDNDVCTTDTCNNGSCTYASSAASCDDGDACTTADTCSAGTCAGTPLNCDDGIACTADSCAAGACVNDSSTCECVANADCDDGNQCTSDRCSSGSCSHVNITGSCDDGSACTTNDTCVAGSCAGSPLDCNDGIACTADSCSSGTCLNDASACECAANADCNDGNQCTSDRCEGGSCTHTNAVAACDDGDACTTNDTCAAGSCAGTPLDCDDGIACTADSCSAGTCLNDASACECTANADCDDGNQCTSDRCVAGSCTHVNIAVACNDGNACTTNDLCSAGSCAGTAVDCNDGIACTVDACVSGTCVNDASNCECLTSADCDDGIPCTGDSCASGVCRNDAGTCECTIDKECGDGNSCTVDLCGSDRMCYHDALASCCGNGLCEKGEDFCTCSADCEDTRGAVCGNGVCEAGDGEDCLTCPNDCNGVQDGAVRDRFCCGGGGGTKPVSCDDNRCYDRSVSCVDDSVAEPCCGNGICETYESGCFCPEDCGSPLAYETAGASCQDGIDNDCDGLADCEDPDCKKEALCWTCDGDGICDPGEDCNSCPGDCAGLARGRKLRQFCCGNGVLEFAERDPEVCDGNP